MTIIALLMAVQGVVGLIQYKTGLPTEVVEVHVILAALIWLAVLWAIADEGRLVPRALRRAEPANRSERHKSLQNA